MPKYRLSYTIERWYSVEVEADSPSEAIEMFHNDKIDFQTNPPKDVGSELQDSVSVTELKVVGHA